ncbi:MAG: tRNA (adenosine(37)-N6)-threonylcarbamoyltransferase complex ATPase subunit type 1 TsaE [Holosporaceae bacterium]|jgi:tRNA threonylcarbamoyladenosine biosynthesis protein TsaE|nr:tRNA (adenosine(37)-N6)-threonylcarbamoyltransferase complex ATPase subunit type 1 TsaE [Holosporaceae bacterium]
MVEFFCKSLEDTRNAAEYFGRFAAVGRCFALSGELGSGKTTFSGYLIRLLNPSVTDVSSPTFTIVQVYDSAIGEIWHVDCHRLKSSEEFHELGLEEAIANGITIIEWPEIINKFLPSDALRIEFSLQNEDRIIRCST